MADAKNTPTKKAVKFLAPWSQFYPGDVAVFDADTADELVKSEIGEETEYQDPAPASETPKKK